ncbi:MarR family winged helix-turn-helix transcriptional regulator [Muricomes intestini]|uniref:DNA-binding MarR family transcriptional regulator n=1 Tax=Muricomes intestini TaxID=1796634 RepID=A0A4R3K109_9FIRM|nr:MarR family winged helix-turn-helix transcriptional regulator [Muricomes intestini]TCS75075.1 DNA-binding MarR family transcriptional regulator [Muricomes intestini]HAX53598.1 hypothetical protein [Lachnospiraceae bacterium]
MKAKKTGLEWMSMYAEVMSPLMQFANKYARFSKIAAYYGTDIKLTTSDYQVIEKIYINEGRRMNMSTLAEELGITQSAFSKVVQRLKKNGIVEKYHTPGNRKDIILCVTAYGKKTYENYSAYVEKHVFEQIYQLIGTIPKEYIETYNKILSIIGDWPLNEESADAESQKLVPIE